MRIPGLAGALTLDPDALAWRPTREPGVAWLPVHLAAGSGGRSARGGEEPGDSTVLVRMDPGRGYPRHRHVGVEEVLVLAGGYRDELGEHRAGDYVRYPAGSAHSPVALGDPERPPSAENPPCVLYSCARGGVVLDPATG